MKPYRFEATYTERELQIMADHENDNINESSSSNADMSWCKCGYCVGNVNIVDKICCKNPLVLSEEEFDCITQTRALPNVCLDKNV